METWEKYCFKPTKVPTLHVLAISGNTLNQPPQDVNTTTVPHPTFAVHPPSEEIEGDNGMLGTVSARAHRGEHNRLSETKTLAMPDNNNLRTSIIPLTCPFLRCKSAVPATFLFKFWLLGWCRRIIAPWAHRNAIGVPSPQEPGRVFCKME